MVLALALVAALSSQVPPEPPAVVAAFATSRWGTRADPAGTDENPVDIPVGADIDVIGVACTRPALATPEGVMPPPVSCAPLTGPPAASVPSGDSQFDSARAWWTQLHRCFRVHTVTPDAAMLAAMRAHSGDDDDLARIQRARAAGPRPTVYVLVENSPQPRFETEEDPACPRGQLDCYMDPHAKPRPAVSYDDKTLLWTWTANGKGGADLHLPSAAPSAVELVVLAGPANASAVAARLNSKNTKGAVVLARADVERAAPATRAAALSNLATAAFFAHDAKALAFATSPANDATGAPDATGDAARMNRAILAELARGEAWIGADPCAR